MTNERLERGGVIDVGEELQESLLPGGGKSVNVEHFTGAGLMADGDKVLHGEKAGDVFTDSLVGDGG